MPSRVTELYGLRDARIRPLVSDSPDVSAPTYGNPIDLPGAASLEVSPQIESQELLGDDRVLVVRSSLSSFEVRFEHVRVSWDALAAIFGGDVTVGADYTRWDYAVEALPLFRLDALVEQTITGTAGLRIVIWKIRVTDGRIFATEQQDFGALSFEGTALPLEATASQYNGKVITGYLSDTAVNLDNDIPG